MVWRIDDPQGNESSKIKYEIVPYTRGRGLDLGCGMYKTYPRFIGVDNRKQWGFNLPPADEYALRLSIDVECDCEKLDLFTSNSMDFVFASHILEHMQQPLKALREWWRVIKPGGHLILYVPHKDFYPNIGEEGANPDHKHDFIPRGIIEMMSTFGGWDLCVSENRNQDQEYSFLQIYKKFPSSHGVQFFSYDKSAQTVKINQKTCCVVRFGGFGDMIQASSIFPGLQRQGYRITVMTTPRGHNIIKEDPHIDEFIIQETEQVPNEELTAYWKLWSRKFDKWINLSESVEGSLLALPGRPQYDWCKAARHDLLNVNYLEFTHKLAGVLWPPEPHFYPTDKEHKKACARYAKYKRDASKIILWLLDGSSVHKHWPWMDNAFSRIMLQTDYKIVTIGNEMSKILEVGWENESRIITKSGEWDIREAMAFAEVCDMVVGPETGVLNAVGMLPMPKIVFLSHSSAKNISKHWVNCISLEPRGCQCWPCHKMHHGWETCHREKAEFEANGNLYEIEGALCQIKIPLDTFWEAFIHQTKNMEEAA